MTQNKVLILLDGSEFSGRILPYVQQFLNPRTNELILFRVAESPQAVHIHDGPVHIDVYEAQAEAAATSDLEDELMPTKRALEGAGYTVSRKIRFGDVAKEIEHFIEYEGVDLVAMTTHGRTGISKVLYGSIAERILHHVTIPILLLRSS